VVRFPFRPAQLQQHLQLRLNWTSVSFVQCYGPPVASLTVWGAVRCWGQAVTQYKVMVAVTVACQALAHPAALAGYHELHLHVAPCGLSCASDPLLGLRPASLTQPQLTIQCSEKHASCEPEYLPVWQKALGSLKQLGPGITSVTVTLPWRRKIMGHLASSIPPTVTQLTVRCVAAAQLRMAPLTGRVWGAVTGAAAQCTHP
jgi:hypothetical protein